MVVTESEKSLPTGIAVIQGLLEGLAVTLTDSHPDCGRAERGHYDGPTFK